MRTLIIICAVLLTVSSPQADDYRYFVGAGGGSLSLSGGDFFSFERENAVGFALGHRLGSQWWFDLDYSAYKFTNDAGADSSGEVAGLTNNAPLAFKATRIGSTVTRLLRAEERWLNLTVGAGGGVMVWKGVDPDSNTTYRVLGSHDEPADFAATELFLGGSAGILIRPMSNISLQLGGRLDLFTGAGADFAPAVNNARDNLLFSATARLNFHFGRSGARPEWKSEHVWTRQEEDTSAAATGPRGGRDSDDDGVPDTDDHCLNTPRGAIVDRTGCPRDGDNDGVPDGLDDCPGTTVAARTSVDIHGCPVDSDFDGIPDFVDACPFNTQGAHVDSVGCPTDDDNDGVPDGLDDCPYTLVGVEVDKYGCIDLEMFSQPMVMHIQYPPGSFEIDPYSKEKLRRLAGLLNFVEDIKLEISGYTDDIGTPAANRSVSEKRAERVRDFLAAQGVATERMKTFGRGETDFVASNQTAEGREKNRRIEINFYR